MSITSKISNETCNGVECYKIDIRYMNINGEMIKYKATEYIAKDTGLVVRYIDEENINLEKESKTGRIYDYKYEFGKVTEEDLIEPDLSEYEIRDEMITYSN